MSLIKYYVYVSNFPYSNFINDLIIYIKIIFDPFNYFSLLSIALCRICVVFRITFVYSCLRNYKFKHTNVHAAKASTRRLLLFNKPVL